MQCSIQNLQSVIKRLREFAKWLKINFAVELDNGRIFRALPFSFYKCPEENYLVNNGDNINTQNCSFASM
jgi:hypothetical protein